MKCFICTTAILIMCFSVFPAAAQNKVVVIPLISSKINTVSSEGREWMDRNLGALRVATKSADPDTYGALYQWGRPGDGHQQRTSPTTTELSTSNTPGHGGFILAPAAPNDWRTPQNHNLWQGVAGINNPCPRGFRLPTATEWASELASWSTGDAAGAFASPLKLLVAGFREFTEGTLIFAGINGYYWSSTVDGNNSRSLQFSGSSAGVGSSSRAAGLSVRCLKD